MRIQVCRPAWLVAIGALALIDPAPMFAEKPSSQSAKSSLQTGRFVSPGQFVVDQLLEPTTFRWNWLLSQKLTMPTRTQVSRSSSPLKQITLLGGDRITAEILKWQDDDIQLRLPGNQVMVIPRTAIVAVRTPDREQEVLYESFDTQPTSAAPSNVKRPMIDAGWIEPQVSPASGGSLNIGRATQPLVYEFLQPLAASRLQLWFRVGDVGGRSTAIADGPKPLPQALSIDFDFATTDSSQLGVQATMSDISVSSRGVAQDSLSTQRVPLRAGWHCLTAVLFADHAMVIVDDALLTSTNRSLGPLSKIRFLGTESAWIDDLQVSQFEAKADEVPFSPSTQDDCLSLFGGEQRFGRVAQVTSVNLLLANPTGDRVTAWSDIAGFALRQSDRPASRPLTPTGLWATIELQTSLDRQQPVADRFDAMIVYSNHEFLVVEHPWLGKFAMAWSQIARIQPRFFGQSLTVDARRLHLGDAIREDFQRQVPDGTAWLTKVQVPPQAITAAREAWLSLDVIDLEPSGPQTPPASPFLRELRAGQLLTRISINDQPASDLNRWIRYRAAPDRPERIRCLLPTGSLRAGENVIRLHQVPLKNSSTRFDNCELSNLRLELVEPLR